MKRTLGLLILILFLFQGCSLKETDSVQGADNSKATLVFAKGNGSNSELYRMNADGRGQVLIKGVPGRAYSPVVSPDGKEIAFYCHESESQWSLYIMDIATEKVRQLTDDSSFMDWSPSWIADGQTLFFTRSSMDSLWHSELWQINRDGTGLMPVIESEAQGGVLSPDGRHILYFDYLEGGGDIWMMDQQNKTTLQLTDQAGEDWWPSWSADGKSCVFQSKRDGNFEIYTMNIETKSLVRLTDNAADDEEPKFSPDGQTIVFSSLRDGHYEIYKMNLDGTNQIRLTTVDGQAINPSWVKN